MLPPPSRIQCTCWYICKMCRFYCNCWPLTPPYIMPQWSVTGWDHRRFADGPSPATPTTPRSAPISCLAVNDFGVNEMMLEHSSSHCLSALVRCTKWCILLMWLCSLLLYLLSCWLTLHRDTKVWFVPAGERQWLWRSFCSVPLCLSLPHLSLLLSTCLLMMDNPTASPVPIKRRRFKRVVWNVFFMYLILHILLTTHWVFNDCALMLFLSIKSQHLKWKLQRRREYGLLFPPTVLLLKMKRY